MSRVGHNVVELEKLNAAFGKTAGNLRHQVTALKKRVNHQKDLFAERLDLFTHAFDRPDFEIQGQRQTCLKCFHQITFWLWKVRCQRSQPTSNDPPFL